MSSDYWRGKSAIVCGGSAGLGKQLAAELARQGATTLALIARGQASLSQAQAEIERDFPNVHVLSRVANVADAGELRQALADLRSSTNTLDLLIQAVGVSDRGTVLELTAERLHELTTTNVQTCLSAIQAFHPVRTTPNSHLLLIGSLASFLAPRYLGGYAIAKHAVAALAQQARLELADDGIHITLACPGPIARDDAGTRYLNASHAQNLPEAALKPAGGAQLKGLEPQRLARDILHAVAKKKQVLIRPRKARLLYALGTVAPRLADAILRKKTS